MPGATPFVVRTLTKTEDVDALCAAIAGCDPLGEITLAQIAVEARGVVESQLRRVAPRLIIRWDVEAIHAAALSGFASGLDLHDVPKTVTEYLARAYDGREERHRQLEQAFLTLWHATREAKP